MARKIFDEKAWVRLKERWSAAATTADIDANVLACFMPSTNERGCISTYQIGEEVDYHRVAVAMSLSGCKPPGAALFATAPIAGLRAAGVQVRVTPGKTGIERVDALHRDLELKNADVALAAVRLFLDHDDYRSELVDVRAEFVRAVRTGELELQPNKPSRPVWEGAVQTIPQNILHLTVKTSG